MDLQKNNLFSFYDNASDEFRFIDEPPSQELETEPYRSNYRKDYARLVHSSSFRRLSGKTQLYPGKESDFFRNRLSHSMEVAQVAKSIGIRLNATKTFPDDNPFDLNCDLIEFAALAHDLGHPPFGHQGEKALDECMVNEGGFEGNAQTLRILAKCEKKFLVDPINAQYGIEENGNDVRTGLNLTMRSLASILKYDSKIPATKVERLAADKLTEDELHKLKPHKGYYRNEDTIVESIKHYVLRQQSVFNHSLKTVECYIMDLADDIAYSTYDLEDGLKAEFYHPLDIIFSKDKLLKKISEEVSRKLKKEITVNEIRDVFVEIFERWLFPENLTEDFKEIASDSPKAAFLSIGNSIYKTSKEISKSGYSRVQLTSYLVGKFIRGIEVDFNDKFPMLSKVYFNEETKLMVEVLKTFNYESMILSPRLKIAEYRGKEIVKKIFDTLRDEKNKGFQLMPKDFQALYKGVNNENKSRIICDYISGMTDRYCIEFCLVLK